MANEDHLERLRQGVDAWNAWRAEDASIKVKNLRGPGLFEADFSEANLSGAKLFEANLSRANLGLADLRGANLHVADLPMANLSGANLSRANLDSANLSEADLHGAYLIGANLEMANLRGANLAGAKLTNASLIKTDLTNADLTGCRIFGISAWRIKLSPETKQQDLVITDYLEPKITVDDIEVAQFVYLLLHNEKLRRVIDIITSKTVLILGRFTPKRKEILDALRNELRKHDYLPILFDFVVPETRDITETVSLLARMARFIIADLTDPSSIPKELEAIVPHLAVPVQPLLEGLARPYAMFKDYWKYEWVLPPHRYEGLAVPAGDACGERYRPRRGQGEGIGGAAARDRGGTDRSSHVNIGVLSTALAV